MKSYAFLLFIIAETLIISGCDDNKSLFDVTDLMCENLTDPPGIATADPALSWKIISGKNGTSQKAFQVVAATDIKLLNEEKADLWNSGKMLSSENILVPYTGKKLTSSSFCYWKVRVWDQNDDMSEWSEAASFGVGPLQPSDWDGDYIGFTDNSGKTISPQLRQSFGINDNSGKFLLYVNSLGYHEVWFNGEKIGKNVLTPAVSQFNKRSLTVTYDISEHIRKGENDLVLWIGQGWYSKGLPGVVDGGPYVRAQIKQIKSDRQNTVIATGSTWQGRNSGYSTDGTWRPHQFGGETVDATQTLADLSAASLDKASWDPVIVADIPDHLVTPQMTESNVITQSFKPVSVLAVSDTAWLIDMGTTLTGWFEITFPALKEKQRILLEYCDHLKPDGSFVNQNQRDTYIASGKAGENFCNRFNYHGFRYVRISGLPEEPDKNSITAHLIQTGYRSTSTFECSDPDMNSIHDMINYTFRCLSLGGYFVDCPQIERLGYGGDGNASTESAQIMYGLAPLYSNWLQAWGDCIREDGSMPHTAPNPYSAGGGPYWCGFIITASWRTYMNYGDKRTLEKYYPVMQQWLGYVEKYSPGGLLQPWPETEYRSWYLGDWATPEGVDQKNKLSVDLVNNSFIAVCYETMVKIAEVLGRTDDTLIYRHKNQALKQKINDELFDNVNYIYGSGSQIDLTYPLLADIVPEQLITEVRKNLVNEIEVNHKGHIACGLVGIPVFTEWAVKNREADLFYSMIKKKEYPGYLYMIDNGATTTWEHWNGDRSVIHNCYNGIGSWFYQAPGGIQLDESVPGYKSIIIDPQIPEGIAWANTTRLTPYGKVSVKWKIEGDKFRMEVSVPVGCIANILKPEGSDDFRVDGESPGGDQTFTRVESGNYLITCNL